MFKKKDKFVQFVDSNLANLKARRVKFEKKYNRKVKFLKYLPILLFWAFCSSFLFNLIFSILWWLGVTIFYDHRKICNFSPTIRIWFGVPGAGKTSMGAYLTRNSLKGYYKVLSNVDIKGAYRLDNDDLGKVDMSFNGEGCHVIYDEGSIDFDNRNFKNFAQSSKPLYFSIHRHMHNRVDVFSQGYDIDKRIRDRAGSDGLFYLKKINLKGFVMYRQIKKVLFIKKDDKQMVDGFEFKGLPRLVYTKSVWDSFNTLDDTMCPKLQKQWQMW